MPATTGLRRRPRVAASTAALLVGLALTTAGCGGDDEPAEGASASPSVAAPTGDVEVPEGVELTTPGTELDFGKPATVAYQVNQDRGSVVELTVVGVKTGRVQDLSAFQLDDATRASTPYYVSVAVKNLGAEDIGGAAVPLFAVDADDTLVQPSTFTTSFERCPSTPLPKQFAQGSTLRSCLVFLLPDQGTLEAVSYRPLQDFEAITWTGDVAPAPKRGGR